MMIVDLYSPALSWVEMIPAGSDMPTRMSALWSDAERGFRSVLVEFPAGWRRGRAGHQPAQEEAVVIEGGLRMSGREVAVQQLLVVPPYATREKTSSHGTTVALVWMTGSVGGWQWGAAKDRGDVRVVALDRGETRPGDEVLHGSVDVRPHIGGQTFEHDVDVFWPGRREWIHLAPGDVAPDVAGRVVLKHWS